jgi:hypothetical protein
VGPGRAGTAGPAGRARGEAGEKVFTARHLRVVLFTDAGMMVAETPDFGALPRDEQGWVPVAVPLSRFRGATEATTVRAVGVFADEAEVFYLGRVRLLVDRRPVEVTVTADPLFARPDRVIEFSASLRGGAIDPRISWDFGDSAGLQEQALGAEVKYLFDKPGNYLVTCTVTDRAGLRPPVTGTVGIRVEAVE